MVFDGIDDPVVVRHGFGTEGIVRGDQIQDIILSIVPGVHLIKVFIPFPDDDLPDDLLGGVDLRDMVSP